MSTHNDNINKRINAAIDKQVNTYRRKVIATLNYVGKACVDIAKNDGSYQDQTGNLRNSISYVVAENGRIISKAAVKMQQSAQMLDRIASDHNQGLVLIVVAGMGYAKYVSAMGYDVLDSSEIAAQRMARELISKLK